MAQQFSLLTKVRFLPLFMTQLLGALNDNIFKQSLVVLFTYGLLNMAGLSSSMLNNLAAILFILPFFIFSSTAGQLADKYQKAKVAQYTKIAEIAIMAIACLGLWLKQPVLLLITLFCMGAQSAFFGPVKYGSLPQLLHKDELIGGNALFETGTSMAILCGMMIGGYLVQSTNAMLYTGICVMGVAVVGYAFSMRIPNHQVNDPALVVDWNIARTTIQTLKMVFAQRDLGLCIIGISWFWYYGATFINQLPVYSRDVLFGGPTVVGFLLAIFSVGIAVGSLLCEKLSHKRINLGLTALGAVGLTVFSACLLWLSPAVPVTASAPLPSMGVGAMLRDTAYYLPLLDLLMLGVSAGFFIVPLYAYLQHSAPSAIRARVVAGNNIVNALFMVGSALLAMLLIGMLSVSVPQLFAITALLNVGVCCWFLPKLRYLASVKQV